MASSILAKQAKQKSIKEGKVALDKAQKEEVRKAKEAEREAERARKRAAEQAEKLARARETSPDVMSSLEQEIMLLIGRVARRVGMLKANIDEEILTGVLIEATHVFSTGDTKKSTYYRNVNEKWVRERKERAAAKKSADHAEAPSAPSNGVEPAGADAPDSTGGEQANAA